MEWIRRILLVLVVAAALTGAGYCVYQLVSEPNLTQRESGLIGFLIAILTFGGSWLIAHVYAVTSSKETGEKMIDTIALQSSEKIVNLSTQLWRLERFFQETIADASMETDPERSVLVFGNRVHSGLHTIRGLRAENNTFLSDWKGVVSAGVREEIATQVGAMSDIIEGYQEIDEARTSIDGEDPQNEQRLERAYEMIDRGKKILPATLRGQVGGSAPLPGVATGQTITAATERIQEGTLELRILRPLFSVTGSGKLKPPMATPPRIKVKLRQKPPGTGDIRISVGAGTTFDFNVHLKSKEFNVHLPTGSYVFHYVATSDTEPITGEFNIEDSSETQPLAETEVPKNDDAADG